MHCSVTCLFSAIVAAMSISALSVFSIWKAPSIHAVVLSISCVFGAVNVAVLGTLNFIEMNVYDTSLRLHNALLTDCMPYGSKLFMYIHVHSVRVPNTGFAQSPADNSPNPK